MQVFVLSVTRVKSNQLPNKVVISIETGRPVTYLLLYFIYINVFPKVILMFVLFFWYRSCDFYFVLSLRC